MTDHHYLGRAMPSKRMLAARQKSRTRTIGALTIGLAIAVQCCHGYASQDPQVQANLLEQLRALGATVDEVSESVIDIGERDYNIVHLKIDDQWRGDSLELLTQISNLKALDLSNPASFESFFSITTRLKLEHMKIDVGKNVPKRLAELANLAGLRTLGISGEGIEVGDLDFLVQMPELTGLSLSNTAVDDQLGAIITFNSKLEFLNLKNTRTSGAILANVPKDIQRLLMRRTKVADSSVHYLFRMRSLRLVDLRDTDVTPEAIESLRFHPSLESVVYKE